ncbi:MAG: hypothetical protein AAF902_14735 [Chloroflexota bacterium]
MDINTLEEKIEKPGYLLLVVIILMLLIIGWVNLISVESETPVVFNWFSIPQFTFIIFYTLLTLRWAWLLRWPNDDAWFNKWITTLQDRPLAGLAVVGLFLVVIASSFIPSGLQDIWLFHPALQVTLLISFLIFFVIITTYRRSDSSRPRVWRFVAYTGIGILVLEAIFQFASIFGMSPLTTNLAEAVGPYDRIYYVNEEGTVTNALANQYGWYYPELRLEEDSHRIAVLGDAFVKGYGTTIEDNLGVKLDQMVVENNPKNYQNPEVFSLGFPDLDTGLFLSETTVGYNQENYDFQDVLIFFDLSDDFQTVTEPSDEAFYYYEEDGELVLHDDSWHFRHDAAHGTLWGTSDGFKPNRFLNSQLMLLRLGKRAFELNDSTAAKVAAPQDDISLPNSFMFYENTDDEALFIVDKQLDKLTSEVIHPRDMNMILVTIPAFPQEFFEQSGTSWTTQFGEADLMLPEQELKRLAVEYNVSFLGMGEFMQAEGLSVEDIQSLFFDDGLGYFTPEGHTFFAQAAYACFYEQSLDNSSGCYIVD